MQFHPLDLQKQKSLEKTPFYTNHLSIQDQILYFTNFYPKPKFIQMVFEQTQASNNQTSNSNISLADSSQSAHQFSFTSRTHKSKQNIEEYELSEIKANNLGLTFNAQKEKGKDIKSINQSQFDYRYLLDELSFQDKVQKDFHFLPHQNKDESYHFELYEKDKSFATEENRNLFNTEQNKSHVRQNISFIGAEIQNQLHNKTEQKYLWDSSSEIMFRKQNKLKRLVDFLNKKHFTMLKGCFQKLNYQDSNSCLNKCKKGNAKNSEGKICRKGRLRPKWLSKIF